MSFRCNARVFFLTYSQVGDSLSHDDIANFLKQDSKYARHFSWAVIGKERHQDQGLHYHVVVGYEKKIDCRNSRAFDINPHHHPKIESTRDTQASIAYAKKDGDFKLFGEPPQKRRKWSEISNASTADEARDLIKEISYRDYVINLERVEYFLERNFAQETPVYQRVWDQDFVISNAMQAWANQRTESDRPKSLILWGPSRTGKTAWARSLGPHMYFNGMFDLSQWSDSAEYAVFDDFPEWDKWRFYKQFLGAQYEITLTDKYRKKRTVRWGKPSILLSNTLPNFIDMEWVRANCVIVNVINKLY